MAKKMAKILGVAGSVPVVPVVFFRNMENLRLCDFFTV